MAAGRLPGRRTMRAFARRGRFARRLSIGARNRLDVVAPYVFVVCDEDIRRRSGQERVERNLRMVEQGERVAITHRRRVVAELRPPAHTAEEDANAELQHCARAATVRLGAPNRADLYPRPSRRLPSGMAQDLRDEVRGER